MAFFGDRIYQTCVDEGRPYDLVRATLAAGLDDVADFRRRLDTVQELAKLPLWPALVEVVERTFNIQKNQDASGDVDASLLAEPLEKELWRTWGESAKTIEQLLAERKYREASVAYHDAFAKADMATTDGPVRRSVSLPSRVARRVQSLARARKTSASRVLVDLIESGLESKDQEKQRFLELAERLAQSKDPTEQARLKEELARITFGE